MKRIFLAALALTAAVALAACQTDADKASYNLSQEAEMFKITRNIVFYNTWTDTEVVQIQGRCSIDPSQVGLAVTCKEDNGYKKHYLGKTANLSYFAVQMDAASVSTNRTKIVWKPTSFIPEIEVTVGENQE